MVLKLCSVCVSDNGGSCLSHKWLRAQLPLGLSAMSVYYVQKYVQM